MSQYFRVFLQKIKRITLLSQNFGGHLCDRPKADLAPAEFDIQRGSIKTDSVESQQYMITETETETETDVQYASNPCKMFHHLYNFSLILTRF